MNKCVRLNIKVCQPLHFRLTEFLPSTLCLWLHLNPSIKPAKSHWLPRKSKGATIKLKLTCWASLWVKVPGRWKDHGFISSGWRLSVHRRIHSRLASPLPSSQLPSTIVCVSYNQKVIFFPSVTVTQVATFPDSGLSSRFPIQLDSLLIRKFDIYHGLPCLP